jgi:hypothetical protein
MGPARAWRNALGRFFAVAAVGNLVWEVAQMPLYTLWRIGSAWEIAFAALHCTIGDVLIAGASLVAGLLLSGGAGWSGSRFLRAAAPAVVLGLAVAALVEHVAIARSIWTYSELMPVMPGLGTGLAPLAQWVVVPSLAFMAACLPWRGKLHPVRAGEGEGEDLGAVAITASAAEPEHLARITWRAS